jgi:hypothetical protein
MLIRVAAPEGPAEQLKIHFPRLKNVRAFVSSRAKTFSTTIWVICSSDLDSTLASARAELALLGLFLSLSPRLA